MAKKTREEREARVRDQRAAREKIAQMRAAAARRRRMRWIFGGSGAAVVVAAIVVAIVLAVGGGGATATARPGPLHLADLSTLGSLKAAPAAGSTGPEGVPIANGSPLAGPASSTTGQAIDGISCETSEQTLFHIHAHLTIFVNGVAKQVPAAIGIPGGTGQSTAQGTFITSGKCFYWLHTHAADGVIHIESPVQRTYTLGDFFDEWGQTLSSSQVGPDLGHVTALYNGKVFKGNPRNIPLNKHAQIQLEVGTPLVAPESITWPSSL